MSLHEKIGQSMMKGTQCNATHDADVQEQAGTQNFHLLQMGCFELAQMSGNNRPLALMSNQCSEAMT